MIDVSLFASAVRPQLWTALFKSLEGTSIEYEVVFCGNKFDRNHTSIAIGHNFTHIRTENIKPAQCYEIARRHCIGETVMWIADDCEFPNDVVGKAYKYWKSQNNEKLILSIQTKESGYRNETGTLFDMNIHRFFGGNPYTPLMAPLCLMSRNFLDDLGGFDRRYICGQYENQCVTMAYTKGAIVEIFGGADCYIDIDHLGKSIITGECTDHDNFRQRPFATGYEHDRKILENSWVIRNSQNQPISISLKQLDDFEPYKRDISLTKSESFKGKWD